MSLANLSFLKPVFVSSLQIALCGPSLQGQKGPIAAEKNGPGTRFPSASGNSASDFQRVYARRISGSRHPPVYGAALKDASLQSLRPASLFTFVCLLSLHSVGYPARLKIFLLWLIIVILSQHINDFLRER